VRTLQSLHCASAHQPFLVHDLQEPAVQQLPDWLKDCLAQHSSRLAAAMQGVTGLQPQLASVRADAKKVQQQLRHYHQCSLENSLLDDTVLQPVQQNAAKSVAAAGEDMEAVEIQLAGLEASGELALGALPAALQQDPLAERDQLAADIRRLSSVSDSLQHELNQRAARISELEAERGELASVVAERNALKRRLDAQCKQHVESNLQNTVMCSKLTAINQGLAGRISELEQQVGAQNKELKQLKAAAAAAAAAARQLPPVASQAGPSRAAPAAGLAPCAPTSAAGGRSGGAAAAAAATQEGVFNDGGADDGLQEPASVNW